MSLAAQTERLDTEQELLCGKGVEGGAKVALNLDSSADDEGDCTKGVVEFEAVVAFRWVVHLGETCSVLSPIEFTAVDDHTANGGTVA